MRRFLFGLLCCLAGLALSAPAFAQPGYYRVSGVAADDTLNVRAAPSASSADIGDLPPFAHAIEVTQIDASGKWGRIVWQEGDGWVAMRFLAPDSLDAIPGTALPAGMLCSGTEPFWSIKLSVDTANYSNLDGAIYAMSLQGARVAEGRPAFPVQIGYAGADASANLLIEPQDCSDGMSDSTYPWGVLLLLGEGSGGRFQTGCCQLPLETGSH